MWYRWVSVIDSLKQNKGSGVAEWVAGSTYENPGT
jgi:hypothetical protein